MRFSLAQDPVVVCFGPKPDLSYSRVFGSQEYAQKAKKQKLDEYAFVASFLVYAHGVKGYRVLNYDSNRLYFYEVCGTARAV